MTGYTVSAGVLTLLSFLAIDVHAASSFTCGASSSGGSYNAIATYLGCFQDPTVSILGEAKVGTIAMTPQYCANYCGARGYSYGAIIFGSQCFCGTTPDFSDATNTTDSTCSDKCATQPSESCGGTYATSLYHITNPQGTAPSGIGEPVNPPACKTNPLCSHPVCDKSKSIPQRVASLVNSLTTQEKIYNLIDSSAGAERLGLPAYEWWSEATHGVGSSPGTFFPKPPADFNHATSFPAPILTAATFDADLMYEIGGVVGREGRAFGNHAFAGFDFWAPNMNPFRDPRWGRGQETPGEDILVVSTYIRSFVPGFQGNNVNSKVAIATCKHYAAYDLETGRTGNDYNPTQQDLSDYYLKPFQACVRDAQVGSIMCSYNAVDGVPSCANQYLLEDVLREHYNFSADYNYVVSDCGAVTDIWQYHNFTDTEEAAASVALDAGVDLECGSSFLKLNQSLALNHTTVARMDQALTRLYHALFSVGFFDGNEYSGLTWKDVSTHYATSLAYRAAVEGMTLLKNDGLLPLADAKRYKTIALIGPYANATTQMQGDYSGNAPFLQSPLMAFQSHSGWTVNYVMGTPISGTNTSGYAAALSVAKTADLVVFCGGIDGSIENEGHDRTNLIWPSNQFDLINQLSMVSKKLIVVQFGAGQVDDSAFVANNKVNSLVWAGYPSQDGGTALFDVLTGKKGISGRLPITQYPASYADEVSIFNINLRPNGTFPGRTYQWYTGKPVFPFGFGLHYTKFKFGWKSALKRSYDIKALVDSCKSHSKTINDMTPFATLTARVQNVGPYQSDYSGLLFLSSRNAGPAPRPIKTLVAFNRAHDIPIHGSAEMNLALTLGSLARADEHGSQTIYPGDYKLALDVDDSLTFEFSLRGSPVVIDTLPVPKAHYSYTVPVHYQPPSTSSHGQG